jgi:DNA end-binding protein Ku
MLELASPIVRPKDGHFDPKKFEDRYEAALEDLIDKKQSGRPIEQPERREPAKVVNLMDALRRSVEAGKPVSRRETRAAAPPRRSPAKRGHGRRKAS